MRRLYLHIGLHKTGTTYLQKLVLENRAVLREAGLGLAPWQDPVLGTHHPIIGAIARFGPERVFAEVARTPGDAVLISAEDLSHLLEDPARARALRDAASRHFDVRVVIFLRRQDRLAESYYAEAVKAWHAGPIGDGGLGDGGRGGPWIYDLDHARRVARLEALFGAGNVVVRLYRDDGPNDLAGALLSATGLDAARLDLRRVRPLNVALHRRKVLFLSRVPKWRGPEASPRGHFPVRFLCRAVAACDGIADDGRRHLMPPVLRRALVARHLAGNRALVARFGLGETADAAGFLALPDPHAGADADWAPPAPIGRDEFAAVLAEAYRQAWRGARLRSALANTARVSVLLGATLPRLRPLAGRTAPPLAAAE